MIAFLIGSITLFALAGISAFLARSRPALATALGAGGAASGGIAGFVVSLVALSGGRARAATASWNTGLGASLSVGVDPLSALFLLPIFGLAALSAVYGAGYLSPRAAGRRAGGAWLCYNLLAASMALAVLARNAILFLVAWEAMTLSSYFLVVFDREREEARRAGIIYLVASQVGTAALMAMFLLLGSPGGPAGAGTAALDFSRFAPASTGAASAVFILAMVGFGTKAGFMPLHVWLPEAHPAAPSHVPTEPRMSRFCVTAVVGGLLASPSAGWTVVAVEVVLCPVGGLAGEQSTGHEPLPLLENSYQLHSGEDDVVGVMQPKRAAGCLASRGATASSGVGAPDDGRRHQQQKSAAGCVASAASPRTLPIRVCNSTSRRRRHAHLHTRMLLCLGHAHRRRRTLPIPSGPVQPPPPQSDLFSGTCTGPVPCSRSFFRLFGPLRRLQHGNLHLYVCLYIVVALLVLAVWKLG